MATTNAPVGQKLEEEDVYDFIDTFLLQIGVNLLFRYLFLIVIWLIFLVDPALFKLCLSPLFEVITFYSLSRVDAHDRRLQAREQKKKILAEEKSFQA